MALLLRDGAVFVHIPKTGGTWVTDVLRDQGLVRCRIAHKHADLEHLRECWKHYPTQLLKRTLQHGPGVAGRVRRGTKFCFVRHPIRWYESYFRFMKGLNWRHFGGLSTSQWHPNAELFDLGADSIDGFMRNVLDHSPGYVSKMYDWFVGPAPAAKAGAGIIRHDPADPSAACAMIGRQEHLADDLVGMLRGLNLTFDEPRIRATAPRNVSHPSRSERAPGQGWDSGLLREVLDVEQSALRRFGYDLE
jgi:hypothetical protein